MGKKRKARAPDGRVSGVSAQTDTFDNSEDEFVAGREKILLDEGPAAKRRRRLEEEDAELMPSDEEVLANGVVSDNDDDDDLQDLPDDDADEPAEEEEDERYWGDKRGDYYGADEIEDEQDALDEEAEARRLQQKQLQNMTEADFGFDEIAWAQTEKQKTTTSNIEKLPPVRIAETATNEERLQILNTRYPEFEPLSNDLLWCNAEYEELKASAKWSKGKTSSRRVRLWAVSAYMAAIAMYLAVLTSSKDGVALPPAELRQHTIMTSLLRARQAWERTEDLESEEEMEEAEPTSVPPVQPSSKSAVTNGLQEPARNSQRGTETTATSLKPSKPKKSKIATSMSVPEASIADVRPSKKSAAQPTKPKRTTLENLLAHSAPADDEAESDFGDEAALTAEEAAAKASKKKSLRFYTSQIAQKAGKRASASRQAGGDDDLPYKERIRDRQERLKREVEQERAQQPTMSDGGDSDADYDENDLASKMNNDANEYYNTLTSATSSKKASKLARAEAHALAAQQGAQFYEEETVGPDGKRKITYAIEKNKGLQPRRKKEVRNPRVKKKKKFEEKKKKLASMRPVYKGGLKGAYSGEGSGIKMNVVKSVKL
jgi:U3 small nucleolar RNA-associated protein 3